MARRSAGTLLLALFGLLAAAFAVGLGLAAWALWQTEVPDGLDRPSIPASEILSAAQLDEVRSYELFPRVSFLLSLVVVVVVFAFYARYGERFVRESAAGRIGTGMLLGMLGLAFLWLVQVPFGLADLWWERRHDVSELDYGTWLVENWFALGGEFLFICLALLIVMGLAGPLPQAWWIPGGAVFVGLALLFTFISPYLIPAQVDAPPAVVAETTELAEEQGVGEIDVRVAEVNAYEGPNAAAAGLGPTRRIVVWDTLLEGFDDDEVRVVLAHEVGHHARDHLWKSVGWYALFAFPGAFLIAVATRPRGGMREPTAVPLALLVLVVLQLVALPAQNAITRNLETEADWVALEATEDPDAARELFSGFSEQGLIDPSPPTWAYVMMETHPTMAQRIAMAEAWRARAGR
ncbi:MAG TPA: M48 family metalloprotease [Gaiellaceae bacterium]|nr:M48 family metalloprotease [Gaiellaceae bacterium]